MSPKSYRVSPGTRMVNRIFMALSRLGRGAPTLHVATVPGRHSGAPRQVPLHVINHDGGRWVVGIYGERGWVHNVRAHPAVTLRRGRRTEDVLLQEVDPREGGPVLERYVQALPHVRPYFDIPARPSASDWQTLAETHPVFRVIP